MRHLGSIWKAYKLVALGASHLNKLHIFQWRGKIICVEFHTNYIWNSTQNILPIHWKIWFLYNVEYLRAHRFMSSNVFLKPPWHWWINMFNSFEETWKWICFLYHFWLMKKQCLDPSCCIILPQWKTRTSLSYQVDECHKIQIYVGFFKTI